MYIYKLILLTPSALAIVYRLLSALCPLCRHVIITLMVIGGSDWTDKVSWRELSRLLFTLIFLLVFFFQSIIY